MKHDIPFLQAVPAVPAAPANANVRPRHEGVAWSGIALGAVIETAQGLTPLDRVRKGDILMSEDGDVRQLRGLRRFAVPEGARRPILIRKDAFGLGRPWADIIVGPGQRLWLKDWRFGLLLGDDWAFIPAHALIDGERVVELDDDEGRLFVALDAGRDRDVMVQGLGLCSGTTAEPVAAPAIQILAAAAPTMDMPPPRRARPHFQVV